LLASDDAELAAVFAAFETSSNVVPTTEEADFDAFEARLEALEPATLAALLAADEPDA